MADSVEADPLIGRLLAQKFRIDRLLGAGAMGRVYLAEQTNLGKQVALKVLHNAMAGDAALAKRFYREAKSASMLSHPNILQIIDFGDDGGLLFIAMELLSGRDLYRAIKQDFPFPLERVGHIVGQILGALDEAHAKGVVHRDLKPENVMLLDVRGESDFVKVCDFGIAKVASERDGEGSAITMAGMVCGTPEYMSPEQARGDALDGRSDLYAAAVILYQMVAGDVPFRAESALGVITKHLTEEPTPPSKRLNASVPEALEAVILRGLKKNKDERYASAAEMRQALFDALGMKRPTSGTGQRAVEAAGRSAADAWAATGVSTPASTPAQAATRPSPSSPSSHPSVHGELAAQPAAGGRRAGVIAVAFALTAALAGGAWVMMAKKGDAAVTTAATVQPPPKLEPAPAPPTTPAVAPIPSASDAIPPTVVASAAPHGHKHHESVGKPAAAARPVAAAASVAAAPEPVAVKPSTAPKTPLAEGDALFRGGDVEGALAKYQDAARANPSDAKAQKMIGKCYNRLGQHDRAVPYLKKYLELAPDAADAAFIQAQIDQK
ncbi:MAG TPA: protein kinase [Polyangia bacterium]